MQYPVSRTASSIQHPESGNVSSIQDPVSGHQSGSAMIETVILLPIFAFMVYIVIVIGEMSITKCKVQTAVRYAAFKNAEQASGDVKELFFPEPGDIDRSYQNVDFTPAWRNDEGRPTLTCSTQMVGDDPKWREWAVPYDKDEMDNALENVGIRVVGSYVYDPDKHMIVYEQEEKFTRAGFYFEKQKIFDEAGEVIAGILNDGMTSSRCETAVQYKMNPNLKLPSSFSTIREGGNETFDAGTVDDRDFSIDMEYGLPAESGGTARRDFKRVREGIGDDIDVPESKVFVCESIISNNFNRGTWELYKGLIPDEAGQADAMMDKDTSPFLTGPEGMTDLPGFEEFPTETDEQASDYWDPN